MNNDLKSTEALKAYAREVLCGNNPTNSLLIRMFDEIIDNAPSVFSCNACKNMGNEWECVDCHDYSNYVHYDERLQGDCEKCDFRKFTERFIDGTVDLMNKYGITSFDQLSEKLKGGDGE